MRVVSVFNAFDTPNPGGVQVAGRVAWQAIAQAFPNSRALLLSLESGATADNTRTISGSGRLGAILAARRAAGEADVALFWHLDLLKVAPFMRLGATCKKVIFLHGTEAWRRRGAVTRRLLSGCDVVFSNTASTLRRAIEANPELAQLSARVVHLGLGVPTGDAGAPDGVPAAAMISRLHPGERYKGHDEVIAAWPLILQRIPNAQLWVIGEGPLRADLEAAAAAAGVQDHVRFFGRVSEAEKDVLLRRSRCLLLPSTGEGFGLVYLEAMRLGRPCLVGIDGGYEVINPPEAGLSVTQRTPQEIADATVRLLRQDDAWQQWSRGARTRYEREFTGQKFGERIVGALKEAAL